MIASPGFKSVARPSIKIRDLRVPPNFARVAKNDYALVAALVTLLERYPEPVTIVGHIPTAAARWTALLRGNSCNALNRNLSRT